MGSEPDIAAASSEDDDAQLLERYQQGDAYALDLLFLRYRCAAYRVAFRMLGHEADALDAVQEGFIKALTHLGGFEQRSAFKTWLLRIVSNASLDLGRRRRRRDTLSFDGLPDGEARGPMTQTEPSGELEHQDLRQALEAALQQLPEGQRLTFVLHVDGQLSYREVADTLGISIGTVMSRLFYARQKLRTLLGAHLIP